MGDKEKTEKAEEERPLLLFSVWTLSHNVGGLMEQALAEAPLTPEEFGFYSAVFVNKPVTPAALAELAGMPATTVSSYLNRLIERGHITKRRNPKDGRSFLVELTKEGEKAVKETWLRFVPAEDAVFEALALPPAEAVEALSTITEAVQAAMRTHDRSQP
jgi:DNA-binding MarR family transcriptional regulator